MRVASSGPKDRIFWRLWQLHGDKVVSHLEFMCMQLQQLMEKMQPNKVVWMQFLATVVSALMEQSLSSVEVCGSILGKKKEEKKHRGMWRFSTAVSWGKKTTHTGPYLRINDPRHDQALNAVWITLAQRPKKQSGDNQWARLLDLVVWFVVMPSRLTNQSVYVLSGSNW